MNLDRVPPVEHARSILLAPMRRNVLSSADGLVLALLLVASPALAQDGAAVTSLALARRHAPHWRFNGWVPGDDSPMNKSEDHFPMSVRGFFAELDRGRPRIVTREAHGARPGESEERALRGEVTVERDRIAGMPRNMAGDAPGAAPTYFACYSKEGKTYVEYWLFYPQDRARVKVLGVTLPIGGHRGDWEGISLALDSSGRVVRGYYNRHGEKDAVAVERMRFEQGHPVVYVSQGKHACYPEPGRWHDMLGFAPLVEFDEFFLGNGCSSRSWEGRLLDLDARDPEEFSVSRPSTSLGTGFGVEDWRDFAGGWGPDRGFLGIGGSPVGPRQHGCYRSGDADTTDWEKVRARGGVALEEVPLLEPEPVPIRR